MFALQGLTAYKLPCYYLIKLRYYQRELVNFYVKYLDIITLNFSQKQPPRGVLSERCSENMQQIYRRTPDVCRSVTSIECSVYQGKLLFFKFPLVYLNFKNFVRS